MPPVVLRKDLSPSSSSSRAHRPGSVDNLRPIDGRIGIQIENETVGLFELSVARSPNVDFKDTHLDQ